MNVNDESDRQLRAAMHRLLDGTPIRSNDSLTVSALAVEAGVSRRTAGPAKGVLRDFEDAIVRRNRSLGAEPTTLACRVALLSEENEQLRGAAGTGPVVVLPSGGNAGS